MTRTIYAWVRWKNPRISVALDIPKLAEITDGEVHLIDGDGVGIPRSSVVIIERLHPPRKILVPIKKRRCSK